MQDSHVQIRISEDHLIGLIQYVINHGAGTGCTWGEAQTLLADWEQSS